MAENFTLSQYSTKSWNRQIVDSATLFATRVKYVKILQEQFAGLIILSFTPSTFISNIEARIFFIYTHIKMSVYTK